MGKRIYNKALKINERKDEYTATAKSIRISPYKVRAVLDEIRGKKYNDAVAYLENLNKSSSLPILKVLKSAAANAENNKGVDVNTLYVSKCYANEGVTYKRGMSRARGSMSSLLKRTSHITVVLDIINK
ncbi:MAG: 50S ribosomal protein L22 [Clostridia bacterium]|nr:50S ribosomal protein L22 [Clostridia bacterium]